MISRAAGYHSGFNAGYNIAEAVNFALPAWLNIADQAKSCKCVRDSVTINMGQFRRKLAGLPAEESEDSSVSEVYSDLDLKMDHDGSAEWMEEQLNELCKQRGRAPAKAA